MLTLFFAAALAFPIPASPPIPVTTPVFRRPPNWQYGVHVASNGSMALAVWNDRRNGDDEVTACRISADGTPLDPLGIAVRAGSEVTDVFWTGDSFAVVTAYDTFTQTRADLFYEVAYIDTEGGVTQGNPLATDMVYAGHLGEGAETRLLFLPGDDVLESGSVVGLQGSEASTAIPARPWTFHAMYRLTASNGSSFLVLRAFQSYDGFEGGTPGPVTYSSEVLDRDGNPRFATDPHLPSPFLAAALTSDGQGGYALFGYRPNTNEFVMVRLDSMGVATGFPQFIQPYYPSPEGRGAVYATTFGRDFFASWAVGPSNGHTYTYLSRNGGIPVMTSDRIGSGYEAEYDPVSDLLLTSLDEPSTSSSLDLFVQKGRGAPAPLTYSANPQTNAAVAAGSNGFLAEWTEQLGTDSLLYVRRFAADGTPIDEPQVADTASAPYQRGASVTSSGNTYLVTWDRTFARRLDARSGQWLDVNAFLLHSVAAASNGSDVLALTAEECPSDCIMARSVSMSGGVAVSDGVRLPQPNPLSQPVIASDGQNYLAVWVEGGCDDSGNCVRPPGTRIVFLRLRPDGSHIEAAPTTIESSPNGATIPTVAWNGKTYLVAWMDPYYDGSIAAAYVGTDGSVQSLGIVAQIHQPISFLKVVAHAGEFVIFSQGQVPDGDLAQPGQMNMTLVDGSTTPFDLRSTRSIGHLDAASDGAHLMLAYGSSDGATGRVGRVFLEPRLFPTLQRAVR